MEGKKVAMVASKFEVAMAAVVGRWLDESEGVREELDEKKEKESGLRTFEKNAKCRPSGINANHWKWFLKYQLKDDTKEAITNIENQDESFKELSQNLLAQILGNEHPGLVRDVDFGPCPTQVFELDSLGSAPTLSCTRPPSFGNHDLQEKS
ncbi:hypothetical protein AHAS_Ahas20G0263100 [Arachis hypogaea]